MGEHFATPQFNMDTENGKRICKFLSNPDYRPPKKENRWLLVLLGMTAGGILEILQETVAIGRSGTWEDFAANTAGALAGFGLMTALHRRIIGSSKT